MQLNLGTAPPATANVSRMFALEVPKDCGRDDDLVIQELNSHELFQARMTELVPVAAAALQMRISIAVERIIREALDELSKKAADSLKK